MGKCYTLKGQSLENGLYYVFQGIGNILLQKVQNQHGKAQTIEHRVRVKGMHSIRSLFSQISSSLLHPQCHLHYKGDGGKRLKLHSMSLN